MNQVEKVARAIAAAAGENPDENSGLMLRPHFVRWQEYEAQARAAIKAMRDPTDEMLSASGIFITDNAREIWRGMIDAALLHS